MIFSNRVTQLLGVDIPIVQAPMGYVAKPGLVSAVANAGAIGLVPGSLGVEEVRADIRRTRELTDAPFGVNLPIAFVRDPAIVDMIVEEGISFVTTSAGSPDKYTPVLKDAGLIVFHVVPSLTAARRAADAGVDGLVVEGSEGAGFKNPPRGQQHGAAPARVPAVAAPAGDRSRRHGGRHLDGRGVRARCGGRADGHPDGRVAPSRPSTRT